MPDENTHTEGLLEVRWSDRGGEPLHTKLADQYAEEVGRQVIPLRSVLGKVLANKNTVNLLALQSDEGKGKPQCHVLTVTHDDFSETVMVITPQEREALEKLKTSNGSYLKAAVGKLQPLGKEDPIMQAPDVLRFVHRQRNRMLNMKHQEFTLQTRAEYLYEMAQRNR